VSLTPQPPHTQRVLSARSGSDPPSRGPNRSHNVQSTVRSGPVGCQGPVARSMGCGCPCARAVILLLVGLGAALLVGAVAEEGASDVETAGLGVSSQSRVAVDGSTADTAAVDVLALVQAVEHQVLLQALGTASAADVAESVVALAEAARAAGDHGSVFDLSVLLRELWPAPSHPTHVLADAMRGG
jgi:hypothetical protein